jgi:hypothetical protein
MKQVACQVYASPHTAHRRLTRRPSLPEFAPLWFQN